MGQKSERMLPHKFPRLVAVHSPIAFYLQVVWDMELQHSLIFLILTGSLLSVMRQQVLDPDAPSTCVTPGPSSSSH
jgi:hypothetical protein